MLGVAEFKNIFVYFASHHFMTAQSKTPGNKVHLATRILRRLRDNAMYSYLDILVFVSEKLPYIIILRVIKESKSLPEVLFLTKAEGLRVASL